MDDIPGAARAYLRNILAIVKDQENDLALWTKDVSLPETYVQRELRRLHAAIEGEQWAKDAAKSRKLGS